MRFNGTRWLILFNEVHGKRVVLPFEIPDLEDDIALVAFFTNTEGLKNALTALFLVILTHGEEATTTWPETGAHFFKCQKDLAITQQMRDRITGADDDIEPAAVVTVELTHVADGKGNA